jgi:hypothetical protein
MSAATQERCDGCSFSAAFGENPKKRLKRERKIEELADWLKQKGMLPDRGLSSAQALVQFAGEALSLSIDPQDRGLRVTLHAKHNRVEPNGLHEVEFGFWPTSGDNGQMTVHYAPEDGIPRIIFSRSPLLKIDWMGDVLCLETDGGSKINFQKNQQGSPLTISAQASFNRVRSNGGYVMTGLVA